MNHLPLPPYIEPLATGEALELGSAEDVGSLGESLGNECGGVVNVDDLGVASGGSSHFFPLLLRSLIAASCRS